MKRSQNSSFIFLGWQTEKRKVCDLIPCSYNPRKISEEQKNTVRKISKNFNLVEIPAINKDNALLAGLQRICDVIVKRYEKFTGQKAKLVRS